MDAIVIAAVTTVVALTAILEIHMKVAHHVQDFVGRTVARVIVIIMVADTDGPC
jgi:hypothetical protein